MDLLRLSAMTDLNPSMDERILTAVKLTLANVIKDTATPHGMRHPLSDGTIEDLRQCLALISARERELAEAAGRSKEKRPHFTDEPGRDEKVIRFHKSEPSGDKG
jgi:chorismate mutase